MAPNDGRIVTNFLTQAMNGEPLTIFGGGNQTRSFCYVADLVDGLLLLAESTVTDPVNLGNPVEMSVNEFADIIVELLGDTGREYHKLPESDPVRRRPDITKVRNLLGWAPTTSLDDGLRRTLAYLTALDR